MSETPSIGHAGRSTGAVSTWEGADPEKSQQVPRPGDDSAAKAKPLTKAE